MFLLIVYTECWRTERLLPESFGHYVSKWYKETLLLNMVHARDVLSGQ